MIEYKKLLFIFNPKAGKGNIAASLSEIIRVFEEEGYMPTVYRTMSGDDGSNVAEQYGGDFDLVVCAGGDGTLNNIVTGIMRLPEDRRPRIGFIPAGSTNDTKSSYNLPKGIVDAARTAVSGTPFKTDIGRCNDKYFTYVASLGDLSAVSCFTPQFAKSIFGRTAYITEGIKTFLNMKSHIIKVTYEHGVIEGDFFLGMVTNALSVGGFQGITGEDVVLSDGLFEVMLLKKPANPIDLGKEIDVVLNSNNSAPLDDDLVIKFKTGNAVFESDEDVQWVVDGEDAGRYKIVEITNIRQAVEIMSGN